MRVASGIIAAVGFFVSLYFSGYVLTSFSSDSFQWWAYAAFALTMQFGSAFFAVLTTREHLAFIAPALVMAALNVFATSAFGMSTFSAEFEIVEEVKAGQGSSQQIIDLTIESIDSWTAIRDKYEAEGWIAPMQAAQKEINAAMEKLSTLTASPIESGQEARKAKQTPVTQFIKIADKLGMSAADVALWYYIVSAFMLEFIVTVCSAYAGRKTVRVPEEAEAPIPAPAPAPTMAPVTRPANIRPDHISGFVTLSWYRVDQKTSSDIFPKEEFMKWWDRKNQPYPEDIYEHLYHCCVQIGAINADGRILRIGKNEVIDMLENYLDIRS